MPKRQSDPQEAPRPVKRVRKASAARTSTNGPAPALLGQNDDKLVMTISPALLSGDGSKPGGGIRRRMNPESLAGRLGPELVKELEALLVAGLTEMPPFTVRQAIQQRYGIDRRHIYDWFHNKGLRVASSEQREERRAARARAAESANSDKRSLRNAPDGNGTGEYCDLEPTEGQTTPPSSPAMPAPFLPDRTVPCEAGAQDPAAFPPVDDYSDEPSFASSYVFGLPPPAILGDLRAYPNVPPELMSPRNLNTEGVLKIPAERTSLWIAEQQRIVHGDILCTPPPTSNRGSALQDRSSPYTAPPDSQPVLPQPLREAFYQSLVDVLPPARGIEESVGTYKAFMTRQVQTYFDKLTTSGRRPSSGSLSASTGVVPQATALPPDSSVSSVQAGLAKSEYQSPLLYPPPDLVPPPSTPNEFSNWLLYSGRPHGIGAVPSPTCTPALSETATTATSSGYWLPDPFQNHTRERSTPSCMRLNELLESPVLRSRNPTQEGPANAGSEQNRNPSPHAPPAHTKPGATPTFCANFVPAFTAPAASSAPPDFVHEYVHGITSQVPAVTAPRAGHVSLANPTIFIADARSENVHMPGALPMSAGAAMPKPSKAKGRPKGRPAQKAARSK